MGYDSLKKRTETSEDKDDLLARSQCASMETLSNPVKFTLTHPFRCLVSGSTGAGKSTLVLEMFRNYDSFFDVEFDHVIYFHPEEEATMTESRKSYIGKLEEAAPNLIVVEGLPKTEEVLDTPGKKLLVIDDLFYHAANSFDFLMMAIHVSRHSSTSFILTSQNLYFPSKYRVTLTRQISDYILFPGLVDKSVLHSLSKQLFDDRKFLAECTEWLKKRFKYQYQRCIWIDLNVLNQSMEDDLRVRANIVARNPLIVFQKTEDK